MHYRECILINKQMISFLEDMITIFMKSKQVGLSDYPATLKKIWSIEQLILSSELILDIFSKGKKTLFREFIQSNLFWHF